MAEMREVPTRVAAERRWANRDVTEIPFVLTPPKYKRPRNVILGYTMHRSKELQIQNASSDYGVMHVERIPSFYRNNKV